MDVTRIWVMVRQIRLKIKRLTEIQDRIQDDVNAAKDGKPETRDQFEEIRQYYLDLLEIPLLQLREAMHTNEIELPPEEIFIERITKRVRPVSRKHLQALVKLGQITRCDMDCIIKGGYCSVEDFFNDLFENVDSFGDKNDKTSTETYDDDGFLELLQGDDQEAENEGTQDENIDPQKKEPAEGPGTPLSGSGSIVPPVKLEASIGSSEDTEDEITKSSSPNTLDPECVFVGSPPEENPRTDTESHNADSSDQDVPDEDEAMVTDSSDSDDSDASSVLDYTASLAKEGSESDGTHTSESSLSSSPDESGKISVTGDSGSDEEGEEEEKEGEDTTDEDDDEFMESDDFLDSWIPSHEMYYWQYELIYAAILTAFRFRERFQSAREAYKADPFADKD
ncbi:hypothetical protein F5Y11DRAFT_361951 [Daldinia sp. FL1419]|nr:hypothetical protein F5Y11DRAFT_361951 [Daldinia sp. FL1419]